MSVLTKAAMVIEQLGAAGAPVKLGVIADAISLPKSSTHRLLNELADLGLVARCTEGEYAIGYRLYRWGQYATDHAGLRLLAQPLLERLCAQLEESLHLYVPEGTERICVATAAGSHLLQPVVPVGDIKPMGIGASGRMLLALGDADLYRRVAVTIPAHQMANFPTLEECATIRARGWALSVGEFEAGLTALAVPVFGANGEAIGTVTAAGPTVRIPVERYPAIIEPLTAVAAEIGTLVMGVRLSA